MPYWLNPDGTVLAAWDFGVFPDLSEELAKVELSIARVRLELLVLLMFTLVSLPASIMEAERAGTSIGAQQYRQ
jgi:hypothetical protein